MSATCEECGVDCDWMTARCKPCARRFIRQVLKDYEDCGQMLVELPTTGGDETTCAEEGSEPPVELDQ